MGAGCSSRPETSKEVKKAVEKQRRESINKIVSVLNKRINNSVYHSYQYQGVYSLSGNLLMFTSLKNHTNEFTVMENEKRDTTCIGTHKAQGVAVGYHKGHKLDVHNQDKFFVLIDGHVEVFCLIDGHGPYGEIVAQIVQDSLFAEFTDKIFQSDFENDYEKIIITVFEKVHQSILKKENFRYLVDYDSFLSGAAVTLVIKKDNFLYCANVGNVMALLFYAERLYSYKFKTKELTIDDSAFKAEFAVAQMNPESLLKVLHHNISNNNVFGNNFINVNSITNNFANPSHGHKLLTQATVVTNNENQENNKDISNSNLQNNFDINEELRRVYECGGEIRKLAGEEKSRIFVKGKYFPGLINTRSIGDQIGNNIGVSQVPHVCKYPFQDKNNYYLFMCTDGITNVLKNETIVNIIENNDVCKKIFFIFSATGIN